MSEEQSVNEANPQDQENVAIEKSGVLADSWEQAESQQKGEATPQKVEAPKVEVPADPMVDLKVQGKTHQIPHSKLTEYAQKGMDYDINNRVLRQDREIFETKQKEWQSLGDLKRLQELSAMDEKLKANPALQQYLQQGVSQFDTTGVVPGQEDTPLTDREKTFMDSMTTFKSDLESLKNDRQKEINTKEDIVLDTELKDLKIKYPEIQWEVADENGFLPEHKITQRMVDANMGSANTAFKDLFFEQILEAKTKSAVDTKVDEIQNRHQKGFFINKKINATNTVKPAMDTKNMDYEQIYQASLSELTAKLEG